MDQIAPFLAPLLGTQLQRLRAYKWFPEWAGWLIAMGAAVFCMWLWNDNASLLTKEFWQKNLGMLVLWVSGVVGGTFAASGAAKAGVHPAISPLTNSK